MFAYNTVMLHPNFKVIVQNSSDLYQISKLKRVSSKDVTLVPGSGVDLSKHKALPLPIGVPVIVFAARLLVEKGVREFVEAAALLLSENAGLKGCVRFVVVGSLDLENPNSISQVELDGWIEHGVVEVWGQREDIPSVFERAFCVVLPSYYGEGLPKVLVEAAASGRAVITTDHPGCRDAILPNVTGLLVPVRDVKALAEAFKKLLESRSLCAELGEGGRRLAESKFDISSVISTHLELYKVLVLGLERRDNPVC